MTLATELQTYEAKLPGLTPEAGKFVLIKGTNVVDVFGDYEDALKAGYERFGLEPFLVKKIEAVETVHHFTRDVNTCPT